MSTSTLAYSSIHKAEYENGKGREAESGQIRSKGRQKTPPKCCHLLIPQLSTSRGACIGPALQAKILLS